MSAFGGQVGGPSGTVSAASLEEDTFAQSLRAKGAQMRERFVARLSQPQQAAAGKAVAGMSPNMREAVGPAIARPRLLTAEEEAAKQRLERKADEARRTRDEMARKLVGEGGDLQVTPMRGPGVGNGGSQDDSDRAELRREMNRLKEANEKLVAMQVQAKEKEKQMAAEMQRKEAEVREATIRQMQEEMQRRENDREQKQQHMEQLQRERDRERDATMKEAIKSEVLSQVSKSMGGAAMQHGPIQQSSNLVSFQPVAAAVRNGNGSPLRPRRKSFQADLLPPPGLDTGSLGQERVRQGSPRMPEHFSGSTRSLHSVHMQGQASPILGGYSSPRRKLEKDVNLDDEAMSVVPGSELDGLPPKTLQLVRTVIESLKRKVEVKRSNSGGEHMDEEMHAGAADLHQYGNTNIDDFDYSRRERFDRQRSVPSLSHPMGVSSMPLTPPSASRNHHSNQHGARFMHGGHHAMANKEQEARDQMAIVEMNKYFRDLRKDDSEDAFHEITSFKDLATKVLHADLIMVLRKLLWFAAGKNEGRAATKEGLQTHVKQSWTMRNLEKKSMEELMKVWKDEENDADSEISAVMHAMYKYVPNKIPIAVESLRGNATNLMEPQIGNWFFPVDKQDVTKNKGKPFEFALDTNVFKSGTSGAHKNTKVKLKKLLELMIEKLLHEKDEQDGRQIGFLTLQSSPVNAITLEHTARMQAEIPDKAAFFSFCYPYEFTAEVKGPDGKTITVGPQIKNASDFERQYEIDAMDPFVSWLLFGGFVYFNHKYDIVAINALTMMRSLEEAEGDTVHSLNLGVPSRIHGAIVKELEERQRWKKYPFTFSWSEGVEEFAWIAPSEMIADTIFPHKGGFAFKCKGWDGVVHDDCGMDDDIWQCQFFPVVELENLHHHEPYKWEVPVHIPEYIEYFKKAKNQVHRVSNRDDTTKYVPDVSRMSLGEGMISALGLAEFLGITTWMVHQYEGDDEGVSAIRKEFESLARRWKKLDMLTGQTNKIMQRDDPLMAAGVGGSHNFSPTNAPPMWNEALDEEGWAEAKHCKNLDISKQEDWINFQYVLTGKLPNNDRTVIGNDGVKTVRDKGRGDDELSLDFFCNHEEAKRAKLCKGEVLALRLYTSSSFKYVNEPLRKLVAEKNPQGTIAEDAVSTDHQVQQLIDDHNQDLIMDGLSTSMDIDVPSRRQSESNIADVDRSHSTPSPLSGDAYPTPPAGVPPFAKLIRKESKRSMSKNNLLGNKEHDQTCHGARTPLPATTYFISTALKKLRVQNMIRKEDFKRTELWRGMRNLYSSAEFLRLGGAEGACMSATPDLRIVAKYSKSDSPLLLKIRIDSPMDHGADISWLSIYPDEKEVLYPPLTYLKPIRSQPIKGFESGKGQVITVKPSFPS